MSHPVIQAEGLGKRYRRGLQASRGLLRDSLARTLRSPLSVFRRANQETFWALKDVSLEVHEGEVLGLIGRNGSGKTTLLKILSRITQPTAGWAEIHGRVGSLLEVGTGFHPELTGRENTYLSGAILGMSKSEITRKFDEIVAFAELDKFIDTPVKHYSSGMFVRLAFAVAAHLEPEILLVDEVLAVGDINFQKKCLGKMGDVARAGRTVVLVSHQLNQIRRLCQRVVWIDAGSVRQDGPTHEVVSAYESAMASHENNSHVQHHGPSIKARFTRWEISKSRGDDPHTLNDFGPVTVKFTVDIRQPTKMGHYGVALRNHEQQVVWAWAVQPIRLEIGVRQLCHTFPSLPLRPGPYTWLAALYDEGELVDWWDCVPEMVVATETYQHPQDEWNGILNIPARFEVEGKE
ncbi:MAG TPA: ABC transporter ATP-binding protein [Candidatus Acidoferrum sp.]|nr:ABC transporter ATP-binding protein [Candidatus Acidoferrum sp.]